MEGTAFPGKATSFLDVFKSFKASRVPDSGKTGSLGHFTLQNSFYNRQALLLAINHPISRGPGDISICSKSSRFMSLSTHEKLKEKNNIGLMLGIPVESFNH